MGNFKNIGLIQVDGKMPNLALMKISQYHKQKGDNVEWLNYMANYDIAYISQIFNFSRLENYVINAKEIIKGGTGINIKAKLLEEIEICNADYSLYPNCNYSIQLFSRGCIRKCSFCVVNEKEGKIRPIEPIELNPKGKHIEILDNNFFANPNWKEAIEFLLKWKQPVNLHGVDLRIMNEEQAYWLNQLRHIKQIHIAWDNPKENLVPKMQEMIKWVKPYKIMCYVLIGYNSTPEEDIYRVRTIDGLGITPFVMPFNKKDKYQDAFTRFVDKRWIYKYCKGDFSKYQHNGFVKPEAGGQKNIKNLFSDVCN